MTADGRVLTANGRTSPDLYWACRGGGGGNFGAVSELTFRTHPVGAAVYGFCDFPWSEAPEVVAVWQRLAPHGADELYLICGLETGTSGQGAPAGDFRVRVEPDFQSLPTSTRPTWFWPNST